jgi:hypothetical protein
VGKGGSWTAEAVVVMAQLGASEWFIMSTKGASQPRTEELLYMWKHLREY